MFVEDTAEYGTAAADIYAAYHALPNSSSAADNWNAMQALAQALSARSGARFVDLGCGAGWRTKEVAAMDNVALALGVDHSREQLALAPAAAAPANCHFAFGDLIALGHGAPDWADGNADLDRLLGTFDVAVMAFVTSHASTQDDLDAMMRAAAAFLAPGGEVIVLDAHPRLNRAPFPDSERYALVKQFVLPADHTGEVPPFTRIRTTFVTPVGQLSVEDYFHDVQSWHAAVDAAGLRGLTIDDCSAPPGFAPGFWNPYIKPDHPFGCSQAAVLRAFKSGAVTSTVA
ncbi:MAG: class I SAM-dependent methyltransferase [Mycobacteriaceae bacterium]